MVLRLLGGGLDAGGLARWQSQPGSDADIKVEAARHVAARRPAGGQEGFEARQGTLFLDGFAGLEKRGPHLGLARLIEGLAVGRGDGGASGAGKGIEFDHGRSLGANG